MANEHKPAFTAYQVSDIEGKKAVWTRIGAAFRHRDSAGFDIRLNVVPLDGRIVLRVPDDKGRAEK